MRPNCLTKDFNASVASLSEKALIARICSRFGAQVPQAPFGPGDDCAVIDPQNFAGKMLCTCDAVILGRHFDAETSGADAGKKAMNRNISDIASMGGRPLFAMTSAIVPADMSLAWLDDFCDGMREAAERFGVKFIGGDVARAADGFFSMHVNILGDAIRPLLRSGAKIGDEIFVTGALGASYESGHHLHFIPKVEEGVFLADFPEIGACTDLSDGIASDIRNIIPQNARAEISAERVPLRDFAGNSLPKALSDGEDYELLFTIPKGSGLPEKYKAKFGHAPIKIGEIKKAETTDYSGEIFIESNGKLTRLNASGFSHFNLD